jgi:hypothetical protein
MGFGGFGRRLPQIPGGRPKHPWRTPPSPVALTDSTGVIFRLLVSLDSGLGRAVVSIFYRTLRESSAVPRLSFRKENLGPVAHSSTRDRRRNAVTFWVSALTGVHRWLSRGGRERVCDEPVNREEFDRFWFPARDFAAVRPSAVPEADVRGRIASLLQVLTPRISEIDSELVRECRLLVSSCGVGLQLPAGLRDSGARSAAEYADGATDHRVGRGSVAGYDDGKTIATTVVPFTASRLSMGPADSLGHLPLGIWSPKDLLEKWENPEGRRDQLVEAAYEPEEAPGPDLGGQVPSSASRPRPVGIPVPKSRAPKETEGPGINPPPGPGSNRPVQQPALGSPACPGSSIQGGAEGRPPAADATRKGGCYFPASMVEWRGAIRKAARSGLGVLCLTEAKGGKVDEVIREPVKGWPVEVSGRRGFRRDLRFRFRAGRTAGAFAVKKSSDKDRWIGDRRSRNVHEDSIAKARIPQVARCRRIVLRKGRSIRGTIRDARSF